MCGIAGIIAKKSFHHDKIRSLLKELNHRGPDSNGYLYRKGNTYKVIKENTARRNIMIDMCLVHTRLSIIDLSNNGSQPMSDKEGKTFLIYNGELYNYLEIKKELVNKGWKFLSTSDTEVILFSYKEWGVKCFEKFNGMWSLAIFDTTSNKLILSRDRFGIKPLYYIQTEDTFAFSSEIKALLSLNIIQKKPNEQVVSQYLFQGAVDTTDQTFFQGINKVKSGYYFDISKPDKNKITVKQTQYWDVPKSEKNSVHDNKIIEKFKDLIYKSVHRHTTSDVPIGTCLSGGIDSTSILAICEQLRKQNKLAHLTHHCIFYDSQDSTYSEKEYVDSIANTFKIALSTVRFSFNEFNASLKKIIYDQEEPFGSASIVAQWFVFQKARQLNLKVMLDGQGADEILGGYHSFYYEIANYMRKYKGRFPYLFFLLQYKIYFNQDLFSFKEILRSILPFGLGNYFNNSPKNNSVNDYLDLKMCAAKLYNKTSKQNNNDQIQITSLNEMLTNRVKINLPELLRYEDKNSMAHSIESRVPFLDKEVAEFVFSLPFDYKINGVITKYLLRKSLKGLLPDRIRVRKDKIGFKSRPSLTFRYIKTNLSSISKNVSQYEKLWFEAKNINSQLFHMKQNAVNEFYSWRLINLKLWLRVYFP